MKITVILSLCLCFVLFAQEYEVFLPGAVQALESPSLTMDSSFTNQLQLCMNTTTNARSRINLSLIQAISLTDLAERDLNGHLNLPLARTLCSNVIMSSTLEPCAWQRGAASIILSNIFLFEGKKEMACLCTTNPCVLACESTKCLGDNNLWNGISKHLNIENLSVRDAVRCYAAISLIMNETTVSLVPYTNALPSSIIRQIQNLSE